MNPVETDDGAVTPLQCSSRTLLGIVALFPLALIAFGLAVDSPRDIYHGLIRILSSRDTLITDYIGLGGMGAGMAAAVAMGNVMSQGLSGGSAPATAAPAEDPFELIEKLHKLLTMGALSQAEFDAKKAELLQRVK